VFLPDNPPLVVSISPDNACHAQLVDAAFENGPTSRPSGPVLLASGVDITARAPASFIAGSDGFPKDIAVGYILDDDRPGHFHGLAPSRTRITYTGKEIKNGLLNPR
jgi:hypothetical protein